MSDEGVSSNRKRPRTTSEDCIPKESTKKLSPAAEEFVFIADHHASNLLNGLNDFRKNKEFCDVTLQVGDNVKLSAHRNVLAAFSPHLKSMFQKEDAENVEYVIDVEDIEMEIMELLLDFAYTGVIKITKLNCKRLILASNFMQISPIRNACSEFYEKNMEINVTNCLGIYNFAETNNCSNLEKIALNFVLKNFEGVMAHEEFLELSPKKLIKITNSDKLLVENETIVFNAVKRWFEHRPIDRNNDSHKILETVRFPMMDPYSLYDCMHSFPAMKANPLCMKLMDEAKAFHLIPDRCMDNDNVRMKPREKMDVLQIIAVIGGEVKHGANDNTSSIECFTPNSMKWYSLASLPYMTRHGAVVSGKNNLYVIGGKTIEGKVYNKLWRYDFFFDVMQEMAPMIIPRHSIGVAAVDGYLYVFGGWDHSNHLQGTVEKYDPYANKWTFSSKLKRPVSSAAVVAYNKMLYVGGGLFSSKGDITDQFFAFDPKTNLWTDLAPLIIPRCAAASCVLDGYIYIIGGCYTSIEFTNRVERYDVKNNRWEEISSMNERRGGAGVAVMDGKIYVVGGTKEKPPHPDTVECYEPEKNTWTNVGRLLSSRTWLSCALLKIKKSNLKELNIIEIVD